MGSISYEGFTVKKGHVVGTPLLSIPERRNSKAFREKKLRIKIASSMGSRVKKNTSVSQDSFLTFFFIPTPGFEKKIVCV